MRPGVEARRAADDAVDLVALLEQQLGQVRAVLAGDAGDQRALHIRGHSAVEPSQYVLTAMTQFDGRIAALVPMRHTSERVKGKNYRELGRRPLFHHIIEALSACALVDEIAVDTDSDLIAEDAAACFPHVRVIPRPAHLREPEVPMNDVLLHNVTCVEERTTTCRPTAPIPC